MTPDPVFCDPDDDVRTALHLMAENGVRRLPVVNKNASLEGVISLEDVLCETNIEAQEIKDALTKVRHQWEHTDGERRVASRRGG